MYMRNEIEENADHFKKLYKLSDSDALKIAIELQRNKVFDDIRETLQDIATAIHNK